MEDLPRIVRFDSHSKINAQDLASHLRVFMECLDQSSFWLTHPRRALPLLKDQN